MQVWTIAGPKSEKWFLVRTGIETRRAKEIKASIWETLLKGIGAKNRVESNLMVLIAATRKDNLWIKTKKCQKVKEIQRKKTRTWMETIRVSILSRDYRKRTGTINELF